MGQIALYILAFVGAISCAIALGALLRGFAGGIARYCAATPPKLIGDTPPPVLGTTPSPQQHPCAVMHDFVVIEAQPVHLHDQPHTVVLNYCRKCRQHLTAAYLGSWTLESFLKQESDASAEIRKLEGMVR